MEGEEQGLKNYLMGTYYIHYLGDEFICTLYLSIMQIYPWKKPAHVSPESTVKVEILERSLKNK